MHIRCIMTYQNSGNTNTCTILQSAYFFYYLTATCFGVVAVARQLAPVFQ